MSSVLFILPSLALETLNVQTFLTENIACLSKYGNAVYDESSILIKNSHNITVGKLYRLRVGVVLQHGDFWSFFIGSGKHIGMDGCTLITLNARLHEIDLEANEMLETIIPHLATKSGIDEDLKVRDMLRWVAEMNNIKASAKEIVLREVIYV